jgi:hypothetical protein
MKLSNPFKICAAGTGMSKPTKVAKPASKTKARIAVFAAGLFIAVYGYLYFRAQGALPYLNSRGQPVFPGGVIVIGILLMVAACIPSGKWTERLFTTREKKPPNRHFHQ